MDTRQPEEGPVPAEDECPWCRFMKAGPCGTVFATWQACIDGAGDPSEPEGRKAAIDQCAPVSKPLWECMMQHQEYYGDQMLSKGARPAGEQQQAEGEASGGRGGEAAAGAAAAQPQQAAAPDVSGGELQQPAAL